MKMSDELPEKLAENIRKIAVKSQTQLALYQYREAQAGFKEMYRIILDAQPIGKRYHKGDSLHNMGIATSQLGDAKMSLDCFVLAYIEDILSQPEGEEDVADNLPAGKNLQNGYLVETSFLTELKSMGRNAKQLGVVVQDPAQLLEKYYQKVTNDKSVRRTVPVVENKGKLSLFLGIRKVWNDPVWSKVIATTIISIGTIVGSYLLLSKNGTYIPAVISQPTIDYQTAHKSKNNKTNSANDSANEGLSNSATIKQTQNVATADPNAIGPRLKDALRSLDSIEAYANYAIPSEPDQYQSLLSRARIEIKHIHNIKSRAHDLILNTYDCYHEAGDLWTDNSPSALLSKGIVSLYDDAFTKFQNDTSLKLFNKWKVCSSNLKKAYEYYEMEQ